ncbi:AAA family ATPase [Acidovorax sp.]|uniref:AAA family ATPase n=1 Tax=Acidovorax sp. TaxID=1872122 RepID=UPI00391FBAF2
MRPKFAEQFRLKGTAHSYENSSHERAALSLAGRRVIHDMDSSAFRPAKLHTDSELFRDGDGEGLGAVPAHPLVYVFDLKSHINLWVHSDNMQAYEYDTTLREKLILPAIQHDLLDVLTTDIDLLTEDFIEGKAAGNVILAKGVPGVGKTLTAEVYSELIRWPLYSIHTGTLGTTAQEIQENLELVIARVKRWRTVVCLLDEADVFVARRGDNLERNAIVAEFLRVLEYFTGLLFLTTNRPSDIDEAILSRCAAIITYEPPVNEAAMQIWSVMAQQFEAPLSEDLVQQLVKQFPAIAPRDIKMLFRLALRMGKKHSEPLSVDLFRRCALFRDVKIADVADGAPG